METKGSVPQMFVSGMRHLTCVCPEPWPLGVRHVCLVQYYQNLSAGTAEEYVAIYPLRTSRVLNNEGLPKNEVSLQKKT